MGSCRQGSAGMKFLFLIKIKNDSGFIRYKEPGNLPVFSTLS